MKRVDLTGRIYGRLKVVGLSGRKQGKLTLWKCVCECGNDRFLSAGRLNSGTQVSCGCYGRQLAAARTRTHGMSHSTEFHIWNGMKERCYRKSSPAFRYYGGRGIAVCERWLKSFASFYSDMGPRPTKHSLDRIDGNGSYSPENCRWATTTQQRENRKDLIWVSVDGEVMTLTSACRKLGKIYSTVHSRIYKAGKTPQEAIAA